MIREWLFNPADTLFFRNGLPFGYGQSVYIESIFPPTPESMQGIVRSSVLHARCKKDDLFNCDIHNNKDCKSCNIPGIIGNSSSNLGKLKIYGPYLVKDGERYFSTPSDIMMVNKKKQKRIFILRPSRTPTDCDIGRVRFPEKPQDDIGHFEPVGGWISKEGMQEYLKGNVLLDSYFLSDEDIYSSDCKVGIKRERKTHTAEEGNLYSISLVRLKEKIYIGVLVDGIPDDLEPPSPFLTKFGGEGKVCQIEISNGVIPLAVGAKEIVIKKHDMVKLVFLTPAYLGRTWYPHGFIKPRENGVDCWEGTISDAKMRLISAYIDKPYKIGGWDLKKGKSKPIRSFIPSGSVYYLESLEDKTIPAEGEVEDMQQIGFGYYVIGR